MNEGIYIATSGSLMQERRLEVVTNNLANTGTVGYKGDRAIFESFLAESGAYVVPVDVKTDLSQGTMKPTGNELDIAIEGDGFFVVKTPNDIRYTREGNLKLNKDNILVTQRGYPILGEAGPIMVPSGMNITISPNGEVLVGTGPDITPVDTLKIVDFSMSDLLEKEGEGLFNPPKEERPREASKEARDVYVKQGFVEMANVNPLREMVTMIDIQRGYESYQKVIQSIDGINGKAVNEIARVA
ncbi:MAG: flagellar basal-body rod protein FlgF [Nitrospinae bacterium]|nr:flagellar basal-body rod protein FlgF [Nitrospinota bacterium]